MVGTFRSLGVKAQISSWMEWTTDAVLCVRTGREIELFIKQMMMKFFILFGSTSSSLLFILSMQFVFKNKTFNEKKTHFVLDSPL